MASIDNADWHLLGGSFPTDVPPESSGTHIGMFLSWVVLRGLGSRELADLGGERLDELRKRRITGRDVLFGCLDGKLFKGLLAPEAGEFAEAYFGSNQYFADYDAAVGGSLPTLYHVEDSWANADEVLPLIDARFQAWRAARGGGPP